MSVSHLFFHFFCSSPPSGNLSFSLSLPAPNAAEAPNSCAKSATKSEALCRRKQGREWYYYVVRISGVCYVWPCFVSLSPLRLSFFLFFSSSIFFFIVYFFFSTKVLTRHLIEHYKSDCPERILYGISYACELNPDYIHGISHPFSFLSLGCFFFSSYLYIHVFFVVVLVFL